MNTASTSGSGTLPGNTITNPKEDLKGITTEMVFAYQDPRISFYFVSSSRRVMSVDTEVTKDTMLPTNNGSTRRPTSGYSSPISKSNFRASYLSFEISFTDALTLMPKFASTLKTLIGNKEKLSEMARTPLNEKMLSSHPKQVYEKTWETDLSLPELTPTCMTLELADRSITEPIGIAKDVRLMVGKFQFLADFVVVDFEPDPRVPLILGRSFLKTSRALIDVYEGEITLRVGKEAITFNLDQTSRYTANYNHMTANRIDVIELASEEYSQEVLGFSDSVAYEANAFIAVNDEPISREIDATYYDPEGDILILEALLIMEPLLLFRS
ncbi:reverse transcriptase domain-containing protein [Tanacetum coccineum]